MYQGKLKLKAPSQDVAPLQSYNTIHSLVKQLLGRFFIFNQRRFTNLKPNKFLRLTSMFQKVTRSSTSLELATQMITSSIVNLSQHIILKFNWISYYLLTTQTQKTYFSFLNRRIYLVQIKVWGIKISKINFFNAKFRVNELRFHCDDLGYILHINNFIPLISKIEGKHRTLGTLVVKVLSKVLLLKLKSIASELIWHYIHGRQTVCWLLCVCFK